MIWFLKAQRSFFIFWCFICFKVRLTILLAWSKMALILVLCFYLVGGLLLTIWNASAGKSIHWRKPLRFFKAHRVQKKVRGEMIAEWDWSYDREYILHCNFLIFLDDLLRAFRRNDGMAVSKQVFYEICSISILHVSFQFTGGNGGNIIECGGIFEFCWLLFQRYTNVVFCQCLLDVYTYYESQRSRKLHKFIFVQSLTLKTHMSSMVFQFSLPCKSCVGLQWFYYHSACIFAGTLRTVSGFSWAETRSLTRCLLGTIWQSVHGPIWYLQRFICFNIAYSVYNKT